MNTVGSGIMDLSPVAALVAVSAHSIVLFLFSSQGLETFLLAHGLPSIPLVPVSSSQAIVGAVIGMGLLKRGRNVNWRLVGSISSGWVITPVIAALISFVFLFFMQNVFMKETFKPAQYLITKEANMKIEKAGVSGSGLESFIGEKFQSAAKMKKALSSRIPLTSPQLAIVLSSSKITQMDLTIDRINTLDSGKISDEQKAAIEKLSGESFIYQWQLADVLKLNAPSWKFHEGDEEFNKKLSRTYSYVYDHFGK
jgi:PiT family inorganic phosphate transporter